MLTVLATTGLPVMMSSLLGWISPYLTTVLATLVVLGVLIFVHELGHFLTAKLLGVQVEIFSLGFPPKLVSKQVGETDYRISVVPLGGYVKLLGENPNDEVPPELIPRSFQHRPLWQRARPTFEPQPRDPLCRQSRETAGFLRPGAWNARD